MSSVVITDWRGNLDTVALIKLIRAFTDYDLARGKRLAEEVVVGKMLIIPDFTDEQAADFIAKARGLGAICSLETNANTVANQTNCL